MELTSVEVLLHGLGRLIWNQHVFISDYYLGTGMVVLLYLVVALPPSVVIKVIAPPSEVYPGGICEFVAPLCLIFLRAGIVPQFDCYQCVGLGWKVLDGGVCM